MYTKFYQDLVGFCRRYDNNILARSFSVHSVGDHCVPPYTCKEHLSQKSCSALSSPGSTSTSSRKTCWLVSLPSQPLDWDCHYSPLWRDCPCHQLRWRVCPGVAWPELRIWHHELQRTTGSRGEVDGLDSVALRLIGAETTCVVSCRRSRSGHCYMDHTTLTAGFHNGLFLAHRSLSRIPRMSNVISWSHLSYHLYADDTQLQQLVKRAHLMEIPLVIDTLQHCIWEIHSWCASRRLQLNPAKTEVIWFGSRTNHRKTECIDLSLYVGDSTIKPVCVVRHLGFLLDQELW